MQYPCHSRIRHNKIQNIINITKIAHKIYSGTHLRMKGINIKLSLNIPNVKRLSYYAPYLIAIGQAINSP